MVKIFVGNLSSSAKEDELRALFEEHGKVNECDIISTYGFVHMEDQSDAETAITAINNRLYAGTKLNVEISHGKKTSGGGRGGGRGGGVGGPMRGSRGGRGGYWNNGGGGMGGSGGGMGGFHQGRNQGLPPPPFGGGGRGGGGGMGGPFMGRGGDGGYGAQRDFPPPPYGGGGGGGGGGGAGNGYGFGGDANYGGMAPDPYQDPYSNYRGGGGGGCTDGYGAPQMYDQYGGGGDAGYQNPYQQDTFPVERPAVNQGYDSYYSGNVGGYDDYGGNLASSGVGSYGVPSRDYGGLPRDYGGGGAPTGRFHPYENRRGSDNRAPRGPYH